MIEKNYILYNKNITSFSTTLKTKFKYLKTY